MRLTAASKYHAQPETVDNIRFHSHKEAKRYAELKLLQRAKLISDLHWQVAYALSVTNLATGELLTVGTYIADFTYTEQGRHIVEDVKGIKGGTPLYAWKRKHMLAEHGITILET
jgi:hypothetical protein